MTDDLKDSCLAPPIIPYGEPPPPQCVDCWAAFWADFDAREAQKAHGTEQVLVSRAPSRPRGPTNN